MIGKDKEEIKAGAMDMKEKMTMVLFQEGVLGVIQATVAVAEWEMKVQTGALAVIKAATAEIQDRVVPLAMDMEMEIVVHQAEWEAKVQTGALVVIKAATGVVIQMTRII